MMTDEVNIDKLIKEYGYINFEPVTERWSEYILSDKTVLKIKTIPLKFLDAQDYPMNSALVISTFSPPELKGEPSTSPPPAPDSRDIQAAVKEMDMRFDTIGEPWNEYNLENGIKVFIRTIATSINSSILHDEAGEPRYLVSHQVLTKRYPPFPPSVS
jgi:hypothetical protein